MDSGPLSTYLRTLFFISIRNMQENLFIYIIYIITYKKLTRQYFQFYTILGCFYPIFMFDDNCLKKQCHET